MCVVDESFETNVPYQYLQLDKFHTYYFFFQEIFFKKPHGIKIIFNSY